MAEIQQTEKLHAACDECRARKLKCSGEAPSCNRCEREKITCIYSPQKQMGRPRKRRRDGDAGQESMDLPEDDSNSALMQTGLSSAPDFGNFGLVSSLNQPSMSMLSAFHTNGADIGSSSASPFDMSSKSIHGDGSMSAFNLDALQSGHAPIDPALWQPEPLLAHSTSSTDSPSSQSDPDKCACLSLMYLTLTDLQSIENFSFPEVVIPLRRGMIAVSTMINCTKCVQQVFTANQNVQSCTAILSALAERFHKVLSEVDNEAARLEQSGEKKQYRIGDTNPALSHLHTGTMDCPMGFNIDLEGKDWKRLVKKALKTEVLGGGSNVSPLMTLVDQMEARQHDWHTNRDHETEDFHRVYGTNHESAKDPAGWTCMRLLDHVRLMIKNMSWD